jgi:hypothetical protein
MERNEGSQSSSSLLLPHSSPSTSSLPLSLLPLLPTHCLWRRKEDRGNEVDDNITGKKKEVMRWRIERNEGWRGGEDD